MPLGRLPRHPLGSPPNGSEPSGIRTGSAAQTPITCQGPQIANDTPALAWMLT